MSQALRYIINPGQVCYKKLVTAASNILGLILLAHSGNFLRNVCLSLLITLENDYFLIRAVPCTCCLLPEEAFPNTPFFCEHSLFQKDSHSGTALRTTVVLPELPGTNSDDV